MAADWSRAGFLRALSHGHADREPQPPQFAPDGRVRTQSHPANAKKHHRSRGQPHLCPPPAIHCLLTKLCELLKARAAGAEMVEPTIRF